MTVMDNLKQGADETVLKTGILANSTLFKGCLEDTISLFAAQGRLTSYPRGKVLFLHEEEAQHFYVIASGWVKLFRETYDGSEAVIDVVNDGHVIGVSSLFEDGHYSYGAELVDDCRLIVFPIGFLQKQMEENSELTKQMFKHLTRFRRAQTHDLEHRDLQNTAQRVGCFLLRLSAKSTTDDIILHLPYDKTLIAARLGMNPETFSRSLAKLREGTGLKIKGATVTIPSLKRLSAFACSACTFTFPCEDL